MARFFNIRVSIEFALYENNFIQPASLSAVQYSSHHKAAPSGLPAGRVTAGAQRDIEVDTCSSASSSRCA